MATGAPIIQNPPTLKGDSQQDFWAYIQWLQSFCKSLVLEGGLGQIAGEFTISGAINFADVVFPVGISPPADASYRVIASAASSSGVPSDAAFVIAGVTFKTTSGCRIGIRGAPGANNSVTFNYAVVVSF